VSRGLGRVEQAVIKYLNTNPGKNLATGPGDVPLTAVTRAVFKTDAPTDAQRSSTRRAVRSLAAKGLVLISGRGAEGRWDPKSEWARFYWRKVERRSPSGKLLIGVFDEKVATSETFVSRPLTPQEEARHAAAMKQMATEARALGLGHG
jgi:hypothetical protein